MSTSPFRRFRAMLEETLGRGLTRPGRACLLVLAVGWILSMGPAHAVTEALVATGVSGVRHHETFHRFFSRGTWNPDFLGRLVFERIERVFLRGRAIPIVLDDTVAPKKGPHLFGIGCFVDASRSTRKYKILTFGHCWVVLAIRVRVPFSRRPWALPILFRLYRSKKECAKHGAVYRKKTELARELLDLFGHFTTKNARIEVAVDSAYCCHPVSAGLPARFVFFGSMRPDAVLTSIPARAPLKRRGRPAVRGTLLRKPEQLARDGRTAWREVCADVYGGIRKSRYKALHAQWYRAMGVRALHIVVLQCTAGRLPFRVFFTSDPTLDVRTILETYAGRWSIEVFFRDAKQLLGFADSQARLERAVLRVAPFVGLLYTLLVLWFLDGIHGSPVVRLPVRPWYRQKSGLCFADILRTARASFVNKNVLVFPRPIKDLRKAKAGKKKPLDAAPRGRPIAA
jgi:hypothetical protein